MNMVSYTVLDKQGNRLLSTSGGEKTLKEKFNFFLCLCIVLLSVCYFPFFVILLSIPTARYLYILIAFAFLYFFLQSLRQRQIRILPESLLFTFWFIWTVVTAIWFHTQPELGDYTLTSPVFRGPFFGILCFVMFNSFYSAKPERAVFPGLVLGGILMVIFSHFSGELYTAIYGFGMRLGDLTFNSNTYAYLLLFSVFAATYYSFKCVNLRARIAFLSLILILTALIVLSGSRKALLGEAVFLLLVFVPVYVRNFLRRPDLIPILIAIIVVSLGVGIYVWSNTLIGQRFQELKEETTGDIPFERRFTGRGAFYTEAVELTPKYPLLGIGLDNFQYYSRRTPGYVAHSDYVGILTETGAPGFILYFSAYLVILLRLQRAIALSTSADEKFYCLLLRNALIVILFLALGRWNYDNIPTYIFIALAGRYAAKVSGILPHTLV